MRHLLAAFAALLLWSCGGGDGDDGPVDLTQLGAACGPGDSCSTGLSCLTYTGFSGAELKSCELSCADGETCPATTSCTNIADGPGEVCRAE